MTVRAVYTEEQRTGALALLAEHGLAETARQTGIPRATLASWARRSGVSAGGSEEARQRTAAARAEAAAVAKETRERLQVLLLDKAVDLLQRMDEPHLEFRGKDASAVTYPKAPAEAVRAYAAAVGVLIDRLRLEEGSATVREEVLSPEERRERLASRLDDLAARRLIRENLA